MEERFTVVPVAVCDDSESRFVAVAEALAKALYADMIALITSGDGDVSSLGAEAEDGALKITLSVSPRSR